MKGILIIYSLSSLASLSWRVLGFEQLAMLKEQISSVRLNELRYS